MKALSDAEIRSSIVSIVSKYLPRCRIYLFGSRARGDFKKVSDYDIGILCDEDISLSTIARIREELENIPTLKSFDVVDLRVVGEEFRQRVLKEGIILYDGKEKGGSRQT